MCGLRVVINLPAEMLHLSEHALKSTRGLDSPTAPVPSQNTTKRWSEAIQRARCQGQRELPAQFQMALCWDSSDLVAGRNLGAH